MMKLFKEASVKNIYEDSASPEIFAMKFTDRISVFDYGSLPDEIPNRAENLSACAEFFFQELEAASIPTAFIEKKDELFYCQKASGGIYTQEFQSDLVFLPLECLFRFGLPESSSYRRRFPEKSEGIKFFDSCLVEYTTKLEAQDRFLTNEEVLSLLPKTLTMIELNSFVQKVAGALQGIIKSRGLVLWDGKIEVAWNLKTQELVLVDSIGPDELRMTHPSAESIPLSKELLRMWLKKTNWAHFWTEKQSRELPPPKLGAWRKQRLSGLYSALKKQIVDSDSSAVMKWIVDSSLKAKVCVLGQGGREEAEKWRLQKEGCEITDSVEDADLVWVSQDGDLAAAKVNELSEKSIWTYGPLQEAAELEWSKIFARKLASQLEIPGPQWSKSLSDFSRENTAPVIKKNSLAAGKGVFVPTSWEELDHFIASLDSQDDYYFEEQLSGSEASVFFHVEASSSNIQLCYLGSAQDFKRRYAGDEGPNTGGMGAYVPASIVEEKDVELFRDWALKTIQGLKDQGRVYNGILYMGLMKDAEKGWSLIEYNARFGDPETQALVLSWPDEFRLRSLLALDVFSTPKAFENKDHNICLAMVRKEYPRQAQPDFILKEWPFRESEKALRFDSGSLSGRVSYLVAQGDDLYAAGDKICEMLNVSPWRVDLDWRADIIP